MLGGAAVSAALPGLEAINSDAAKATERHTRDLFIALFSRLFLERRKYPTNYRIATFEGN
jgi:hypothetical protein